MANADADEIKQKYLKQLLTYALTRAMDEIRESSGQAAVDDFAKRFRKSAKDSTPEGPTTEAELRDMVDAALALADEIFGPVGANHG